MMIKLALGVLIGIGIATTFPDQTAELSEFMRGQINEGAKVIVEQTEESLVDKIKN